MPLLLLNATLLTLFGFLLHQNRILAMLCLAASLIPIAVWLWQSRVDTIYEGFGLSGSRWSWVAAGTGLGAAVATYLRWVQGRNLFPSSIRPFALVSISIGIAEELIFRGYFLGRLSQHYHARVAIAIAALFHATYKTAVFAFHSDPSELAWLGGLTFIFGLLLGFVRIKTNSIQACIAFHALFDFWVYGDQTTPWWVW